MFEILCIEWNSIRLGDPADGIVAKIVHKTLPGCDGGRGVYAPYSFKLPGCSLHSACTLVHSSSRLGAATVLCTDTKHECCYLQSLMVLGEGKAEAEKLLS